MEAPQLFRVFDVKGALEKSRQLPVYTACNHHPVSCANCKFINKWDYRFCTNCGYPMSPDEENLAVFNKRLHFRKAMQRHCIARISQARTALYVLASIFMFGIFYLFSDWKETVIRGIVMVTLAIIYLGLGQWSYRKPFTSLLISLIIMLTFAAVNTWAEFVSARSSGSGLYLLFLQVVLIYFLLQGVKGAFHADILEEEFKL